MPVLGYEDYLQSRHELQVCMHLTEVEFQMLVAKFESVARSLIVPGFS